MSFDGNKVIGGEGLTKQTKHEWKEFIQFSNVMWLSPQADGLDRQSK